MALFSSTRYSNAGRTTNNNAETATAEAYSTNHGPYGGSAASTTSASVNTPGHVPPRSYNMNPYGNSVVSSTRKWHIKHPHLQV